MIFFSTAEHERGYFEECWLPLTSIVHTHKKTQNIFLYSKFKKSYRFGTTREYVTDVNFHFGVNYPYNTPFKEVVQRSTVQSTTAKLFVLLLICYACMYSVGCSSHVSFQGMSL